MGDVRPAGIQPDGARRGRRRARAGVRRHAGVRRELVDAAGLAVPQRRFRAREDAWEAGLDIFRDNPLLGTGPNTFGLLYPQYSEHGPSSSCTRSTRTTAFCRSRTTPASSGWRRSAAIGVAMVYMLWRTWREGIARAAARRRRVRGGAARVLRAPAARCREHLEGAALRAGDGRRDPRAQLSRAVPAPIARARAPARRRRAWRYASLASRRGVAAAARAAVPRVVAHRRGAPRLLSRARRLEQRRRVRAREAAGGRQRRLQHDAVPARARRGAGDAYSNTGGTDDAAA